MGKSVLFIVYEIEKESDHILQKKVTFYIHTHVLFCFQIKITILTCPAGHVYTNYGI